MNLYLHQIQHNLLFKMMHAYNACKKHTNDGNFTNEIVSIHPLWTSKEKL